MSGSGVALDTNVAIAVLNDAHGAGEWLADFSDASLPVPVIGELLYGAMNSARAEQNLARVQTLISCCDVLEAGVTTADLYARVRFQLKKASRPIPENDVWIAALCVQNALPLATSDDHFKSVEELRVIEGPGSAKTR